MLRTRKNLQTVVTGYVGKMQPRLESGLRVGWLLAECNSVSPRMPPFSADAANRALRR